MKILITGSSGFIGRKLVENLKRKHSITCLSRKKTNISGVKSIQGDLLTSDLKKFLKNQDIVINVAGLLVGSKEQLLDSNVRATKRLFESLTTQKQVIHLSTAGVLGPTKNKIPDENSGYNPTTLYEYTKTEGEKIALSYKGKFNVTVIRPEFIYGPGDFHVLQLFKSVKQRKFAFIGSGKNTIYPTYIDDLVQAIELVINNKKAFSQIYNVGGPELISLNEFVSISSEVLSVSPPKIHIPKIIAYLCLPFFWIARSDFLTLSRIRFFTESHGCKIEKIKSLGYKPNYNLKKGLEQTIKWYNQNNII